MTTAHDFTLPSIGGGEIRLRDFAGEAVLLVNTASEFGFTPQYRDLEALWRERKDKGLVVLGVPSNDFGAQEPGTNADVRAFCEKNYAVTFPLTGKQSVVGAAAHPLYRWIATELGEDAAPKWNFHKYLIGPQGQLTGAWPSKVAPKSPEILKAIDETLAPRR